MIRACSTMVARSAGVNWAALARKSARLWTAPRFCATCGDRRTLTNASRLRRDLALAREFLAADFGVAAFLAPFLAAFFVGLAMGSSRWYPGIGRHPPENYLKLH